MPDQVRVIRIIEYVGERQAVETQVANSIHGERVYGRNNSLIRIRVTTLGEYPEVVSPSINLTGIS